MELTVFPGYTIKTPLLDTYPDADDVMKSLIVLQHAQSIFLESVKKIAALIVETDILIVWAKTNHKNEGDLFDWKRDKDNLQRERNALIQRWKLEDALQPCLIQCRKVLAEAYDYCFKTSPQPRQDSQNESLRTLLLRAKGFEEMERTFVAQNGTLRDKLIQLCTSLDENQGGPLGTFQSAKLIWEAPDPKEIPFQEDTVEEKQSFADTLLGSKTPDPMRAEPYEVVNNRIEYPPLPSPKKSCRFGGNPYGFVEVLSE